MNSFSAADLPENKYFEKDALIDKKFIVCAPGVPISAALKAGLAEWNFPKVFSEGNIADASPLADAKPAPAEKSAAAVRLSDELDALLEEAENGSSPPAEKTPPSLPAGKKPFPDRRRLHPDFRTQPTLPQNPAPSAGITPVFLPSAVQTISAAFHNPKAAPEHR